MLAGVWCSCATGLSLRTPQEKKEIPLSQVWPSPGILNKEAPQKIPQPKSLEMGRMTLTFCATRSSMSVHTPASPPILPPTLPPRKGHQRPLSKTSHTQGPAVTQSLRNSRAQILSNSKQSRKGRIITTPELPAP